MTNVFPANLAAVVNGKNTQLFFVDSSTSSISYYESQEPAESQNKGYSGPKIVNIQPAAAGNAVNARTAQNNIRLAVARFLRDDKQENFLQELCLSSDGKRWSEGDLNKENCALDSSGGIEAITTSDNREIKVYCVGDGQKIPPVWYRANNQWESRLIKSMCFQLRLRDDGTEAR
ncbi:hypothetical protein CSAL01_11957 [Colletotrichum salicis]|uniref:Fucose-specific lectin n=1 Tax=Colletotrichum salicis TaxID=1209931 RepID=A0A135V481_9PEZI|nr:hypothetical protein CSAL01_11957 [Colletotrichum salicis]